MKTHSWTCAHRNTYRYSHLWSQTHRYTLKHSPTHVAQRSNIFPPHTLQQHNSGDCLSLASHSKLARTLTRSHTYALSLSLSLWSLSLLFTHTGNREARQEATPIYSWKDTRLQCRVAFFPYRRKGGPPSFFTKKVLFLFIYFYFFSSKTDSKMNRFLVSSHFL